MLNTDFDFRDLFVLDLANNHQGSTEHGKSIIRGVAAAAQKNGIRTAVKFQFRQLDTFIHPAHREASDNKHVKRFLSTEMQRPLYQQLLDEVRAQKLLSMCTPFDEESVDIIFDMGFDIIKVASCSATDWPLLEKVANAGLPIICSTGGLSLNQIDDVVSFFQHRGVNFALMYCVSIYPTPEDLFHLNMIDLMRRRYPEVTIGWSTHEVPTDTAPVIIAVAKGAQMFERHVGVETKKIKLNAYSSTPAQVGCWMAAYNHARAICGGVCARPVADVETESIDSLRRGVYARKPIKKGTVLTRDDVYFAMPYSDGALSSGQWCEKIVSKMTVKTDAPILLSQLSMPPVEEYSVLKSAIHDIKALLNEAGIVLNSEFNVEFSHHYGVLKFREVGAVIIDCINREYCKKIIAQLPNQTHPTHYHKRKEETFQVLSGQLHITVDGHKRTLEAGETCLVQPGVWHSFRTDAGCVFEEVSTTHFNDDSYYADKIINKMERADRKTKVHHWGRFELIDNLAAS